MSPIEPKLAKTANAQVNPTRAALLGWDVFVTPGIPIVTRDLPPGVREVVLLPTMPAAIRSRYRSSTSVVGCFVQAPSSTYECGYRHRYA